MGRRACARRSIGFKLTDPDYDATPAVAYCTPQGGLSYGFGLTGDVAGAGGLERFYDTTADKETAGKAANATSLVHGKFKLFLSATASDYPLQNQNHCVYTFAILK